MSPFNTLRCLNRRYSCCEMSHPVLVKRGFNGDAMSPWHNFLEGVQCVAGPEEARAEAAKPAWSNSLPRLWHVIMEGLARQGARPACKLLRMSVSLLGSSCGILPAETHVERARRWPRQSLPWGRRPRRDAGGRHSAQPVLRSVAGLPSDLLSRVPDTRGLVCWEESGLVAGCGGGLGRVRIAPPAWRSCCWESSPVITPGGAPQPLGLFRGGRRTKSLQTAFSIAS
ncbi:uncharacterized protein LOC121232435 [Aquila chrysaetos chrysaetos]|uniref:uncharacterized protein LOC121232435 n=1 Tax=Aquila chrysaetos chrysaetos TaxID=223781 RepID=UPI001B7D3C15|nr:uncharacterized protein LOC121232435 [Aquila chrysaetos chrysaetos]